jgi:hypothetical protein
MLSVEPLPTLNKHCKKNPLNGEGLAWLLTPDT